MAETKTKHGESSIGSRTPEYRAWTGIKERCLNKKSRAYRHYGGRGITICDRWSESFDNFLADMGRSGGLTLDRINNDGNYEPGNCRWATWTVQASNKRNTRHVTYLGERMSAGAASKLAGISNSAYYRKKKLGWDDDRIFNTTPKQ